MYHPYQSLAGKGKIIRECFRFGFWWGLDINAYQLLILLVLGTLPSLLIPDLQTVLPVIINVLVSCIIYAAFTGKLIFYKHFNDTYNYMVHYGAHADKHNLIDIFFNQDKGGWIVAGFIPMAMISYFASMMLLALPTIPYPSFESTLTEGFGIFGFLALYILLYYWLHYGGGTLNHRNKPNGT
nr:hypothetical protein [Veillonella denticariosi]